MILNGATSVCTYAQDVSDTTGTEIPADSTLEALDGIRFIYRPPKSPVSIQKGVSPSGLYYIKSSKERYITTWDSADTYTVQRKIDGIDVAIPRVMNFDQFAQSKKDNQKEQLRAQLIREGMNEVRQGRGLLDFSLQIPGGQSSVFTTIFGKPEVNLRVNGSANMNVGVSIQNTDDPTLDENLQRRIDPTFNQNLQLNIQGTIGDKLTIATDWDTERAFDFQNRLSIVYKGYEDEIIKQIEMGNVSMETGNTLISGGASLFGIKSVAELGSLRLTSVISQQKGESNTQTISGGAQETPFSIRPSEYQNNRHFFIDFFNRQEFEDNVSNPQQLTQAYQISDFRVWISEPQVNTTDAEAIRAAAFADLGVVEQNGTYYLPNPDFDVIDDQLLADNRDNTSAAASNFNVEGNDFYNGYFRPLQEGIDYTINKALGYISLNRGLSSGSYLAVSFIREGVQGESQVVQVGDISPRASGLSYLKLIRQNNPTPDLKTWPLTMRNVYSLGVSDLSQDGLELEVKYTGGNVDAISLPERSKPLLQELGLDRVDTEGAINPDNMIDFTGIVLDARGGNIVFPYLEPFGSRVADLLREVNAADSLVNGLAYSELYTEKQTTASQSNKNTLYKIEGISKGGVSGSFTLGFSLVEGSVKVFANGTELTEGVDYEVDYSFGSITILNDRYLATGQDIEIEYENNQLNVIGQKNFTGLRAQYDINDDISIGGTYFKLKEQPLSDKIRIGNESINNTVLGLDASAKFDTPWITRFIDRIPLLQTKTPSNVSFSGEFAQLRPGVAQTNAVREAIDNGELFNDEENGLSFIDDFEGSELSISFMSPTRWNLAAAPAAIPGYEPDAAHFQQNSEFIPDNSLESKVARSDLRSQFSWYSIPRNISSIIGGAEVTPESQIILTQDVFPGRETNTAQEEVISTLDVYYNPAERGPYNYNMDLKNILESEPANLWGGMTAVLPSGQEDLTQNNVEFIQFWVQPILPDGRQPTPEDLQDYDGKIYIDIGTISEDVVPNFDLNTEDGLARNPDNLVADRFPPNTRSYVMENPTAPQGQFSNENRNLEDVGFDGIPSANGYDEAKVETSLFSNFIEAMAVQYGEESTEYQSILADPSNDDYVYYDENKVQSLPLQERFYRVMGYHEGNTPVAGGDKRAITPRPDTEGLVSRSNVETNNNYYQYEIDFNPADFNQLEIDVDGTKGTYIVDKVPGERQQDRWHLVRIPLSEFERKIGQIEGFQNISHIRFWMSGYEKPFTLRFATFEFIGSQWRKVENLDENTNQSGEFKISTINIEENANRRPVPYRQPQGSIRALNRGVQVNTLANEQSIVLGVEDLGPGEIRMVKRVYPGGLNLLNYSNMRMFVHGEGYRNNNKSDFGRSDAELVIRMGTDLNSNYYEYRQPVTPSDPDYPYSAYRADGSGDLISDGEQVWLYDENSMNVALGVFNELKQLRDQQGFSDYTQRFEMNLDPETYESVPGAKVAIKGNPSLGRIAEIGMGMQNPFNPNDPNSPGSVTLLNAEFWLNELRVSGFDNEKGWKANAKASFKFADFATVNTNFSRATSGFGSLNSRLGERDVADVLGYDLSSTVNLHKVIPDRFGWNFPVTLSTRKSISTPKFLPNQGDVRLDDFINATNNNDDLTEKEKETRIDQRIDEVETVRENFSVNVSNVSKKNSKSKLAKYTIDNTRLSYVYNEGSAKNPQYQFEDNWNFTSSVQYNLSFNNVKLLRPFSFTEDINGLKFLSRLRLGYMPTSVNASANLNRSYSEKRRRAQPNENDILQVQPLQQSHNFTQRTTFGFNYNLTPNIPISFRTNTNYDLSSAGVKNVNKTGIEVDSSSYSIIPTFKVLNSLISDTLKARRSNYEESYTASWRPKLNNINALNWLTYSASYSGGYGWTNSSRGSNLGARVSNSFRLSHSVKLDVGSLIERMGFYENMVEADEEATTNRKKDKNTSKPANANKNGNGEKEGAEKKASNEPDLLKDLQYIGRKGILALLSFQNIDLSYNQNKTSNQSGYSGDSQLYYAFNEPGSSNFSPPLGYRLGLTEEIPLSQLIQENNGQGDLRLPKQNSYSDDLAMSTKMNMFKNFSIDLSWSTRWDERKEDNITLSPSGDFGSTISSSGNISSSVWAFGSGYRDLFERQLQTAFDDFNGTDVLSDSTGNNDGRIVMNRNTLAEDFRKSYLGGGSGAIGRKGYTPIPMPNWRVTWSGVQNFIPFIGNRMKAATLSHRYEGSYKLGWNMNTVTGLQNPERLGSFSLYDNKGQYEPTSVNVDQRFDPLIQLNVTWESDLRTQISYKQTRTSSLALSSRTVSERTSKGLNMAINYTFRNITIPFLPKIKNNIDVTINGGIADDLEEKFYLSQDINNVLSTPPSELITEVSQYDYDQPDINGQYRMNASIVLGYRFSQTVTSNFEYTFRKIEPKTSGIPPTSNHDIRFNFRIAIQSR